MLKIRRWLVSVAMVLRAMKYGCLEIKAVRRFRGPMQCTPYQTLEFTGHCRKTSPACTRDCSVKGSLLSMIGFDCFRFI
ncbi:MAG: hypothetical protein J6X55_08355 [Victivallales bacterium]|nr:hypothetical protein [Victivallales bacterium]